MTTQTKLAADSYRFKTATSSEWITVSASCPEDALDSALFMVLGAKIAELQMWDGLAHEPVEIYDVTNIQSGDRLTTTDPELYPSEMWHVQRAQTVAPARDVSR